MTKGKNTLLAIVMDICGSWLVKTLALFQVKYVYCVLTTDQANLLVQPPNNVRDEKAIISRQKYFNIYHNATMTENVEKLNDEPIYE